MLAALLQQAQPRQPLTIVLIYVVGFGLIFYWLVLRPQRKMQQKHRELIDALKKGDEVMTEGGIVGNIVHLTDDRVTLKSGDTRLLVSRGKIARVMNQQADGD
jgi:preprotein translocase subunit YajC